MRYIDKEIPYLEGTKCTMPSSAIRIVRRGVLQFTSIAAPTPFGRPIRLTDHAFPVGSALGQLNEPKGNPPLVEKVTETFALSFLCSFWASTGQKVSGRR